MNPIKAISAFSAQGAFMKSLAEAYKSSEEGFYGSSFG